MKRNRLLSIALALSAFAAAQASGLESTAPAVRAAGAGDGWVNLCEGTDLTKHWITEGNWTLTDGVFTLTPRPGETGWKRWKSYLWAKKIYGDFEIKFDYKIGKAGNSGFFFRVDENKKYEEAAKFGLEVQIFDSAGSDKLNDHTSGGLIPAVPPTKNAAKPVPEWNAFHITVKDDRLTVILNDVKVQDQVDLTKGVLGQRPKTGAIGFQDEGLPISLRNIKVREFAK
jgi:hypothetical protein